MENLFQEEQESLIPDDTIAPTRITTSEQQEDLASQIQLGNDVMGTDVAEQGKEDLVFSGYSGARELMKQTEYEVSRGNAISALATSLQTEAAGTIATQMLATTMMKHDEFALENKTIEAIATSLPAEIANVVDDNVLADMAADNAFQLKLKNFLAERQDVEDNESLFEETLDFFKAITAVEVLETITSGGERSINDDLRSMLYGVSKLPVDQQEAALRGPVQKLLNDVQLGFNNPNFDIERLSAAMDGSDKGIDDLAFWQGVGIVALPFELTGVKTIANIAKKLGNKQLLASEFVGPIDTRSLTKTDVEVGNTFSPFKLPTDPSDGLAPAVRKNLEMNQRMLDNTLNNFTAPESNMQAIAKAQLDFDVSYGGERVLASSFDGADTGTITFKVGTIKGDPFKTESQAQRFLTKTKLDGEIKKHPSGGFSIEMKTAANGQDSGVVPSLNFFSKNFSNIDIIIAKSVVAGGRGVEGAQHQMYQQARRTFDKSMKILSTKKGIPLNRVITRGIDNNVWHNPREFFGEFRSLIGRAPTNKEQEAYFAYKQLSDFDWEMKNKVLYTDSAARGERLHSLAMGGGEYKFTAARKEIGNVMSGDVNKEAAHVVEEGMSGSTYGAGKLNKEALDKLNLSHDLVKLNPTHVAEFFENGVTSEVAKWVFVPKSAKSLDLPSHRVPYKDGGRRVNNMPAYLKTSRIKKGADGTAVRLPDIATHGAASKKEANKIAEALNELHGLLKGADPADAAKLDDLVASKGLDSIGITTAKNADDFFNSYNLYKYDEIKFQGVRDREQVQLDNFKDIVNLSDETEVPVMSGIRNQMNGMRGDRLMNINGEEGLILDPVSALANALDTTGKFASIQGYRQNMLDFMVEKFGRFLDHDPRSNPINILTATTKKGVPVGQRKVIEAHQQYIQEIVSKRTGWEEQFLQTMENIVNYAFDKGVAIRQGLDEGWLEKGLSRKNTLEVMTKDPASRLKNIVFNAKLGLFNSASTIIQAINVVNIVALSPKHGWTAAKNTPMAQLALIGGVDGAVRKQIAKGWKVGGFDSPDDFIEFMDEFDNLGLGHLERGIADIAGANASQLGSSQLGTIAEWGRIPFKIGELTSRLTSYGAARLEYKALNKGKTTTPEARLWIQNRTHDLALGLSTADVQLGFRGLAGVPTQFFSYPFRLANAMLPKQMGGGTTFTGVEKTRLVLMQALMFGSAGIPIVDNVVNHYVSQSPDLDPLAAKALTNGFIDTMIYGLTDGEADTNLAGRGGVGQGLTDIVRGFVNDSALDFAAGAGGGTTGNIVSVIGQAIKGFAMFKNPTIDTVTMGAWMIMKSEISSLKMIDKTVAALRYGHLYTKTGARFAKISDMTTFLMVGGLTPQIYEDAGMTFIAKQERKDAIKEWSGVLVKLNLELGDAMITGDDDKVANLQGAITLISLQTAEMGIEQDVYRAWNSIDISEGMLEKSLQQMYTHQYSIKDGETATGVNQGLINKYKGQ